MAKAKFPKKATQKCHKTSQQFNSFTNIFNDETKTTFTLSSKTKTRLDTNQTLVGIPDIRAVNQC